MAKANEIINLISGLTEEKLERLKNYILTRLHIAVNAPEAHIEPHACPHCGGKHVIKPLPAGTQRSCSRFQGPSSEGNAVIEKVY